jgi:hypothetical protein
MRVTADEGVKDEGVKKDRDGRRVQNWNSRASTALASTGA